MKTLAVALLFALSLCSAGLAARAEARSHVRIAAGGLSAPVLLADGGGKGGGDGGSGGDKGGDGDDDERDEEELRVTGRAALDLVDPGAAQDVLRLRLAAGR